MSILGPIASFATGTYARVRTAAGAYVEGYWQAGASTADTLVACVQPVSGNDLKTLPEGRRADETKVIYTVTEVRALPADKITIDGAVYEVWQVHVWAAFGLTYYRAMVSKIAMKGAGGAVDSDVGPATQVGTGTVA